MSAYHGTSGRRPSAVRLVFAYGNGQVTLVSRQSVEMTLPPTHPIEDEAPLLEFAAELRGADGRVLHRVPMPNPLAPHREVFSEEPDRSIHRVPVEHPQGAFTVVVPDHPEGDSVALVATGRADEEATPGGLGARREVARVPLRGPDGERTERP